MLEGLISRLEKINATPLHVLLFIAAIGFLRYVEEWPLAFSGPTLSSQTLMMLDYATSYLSVFVFFAAGQKLFMKKASYAPLLLGFLLPLLPPAMDHFLYANPIYFYPQPNVLFLDAGMTIGEITAVYLGILLFASYMFVKDRQPGTFVLAALFAWGTLQLLGSVHPYVANALAGTASFAVFFSFFYAIRLLLFIPPLLYIDEGFAGLVKYRLSRIFLLLALSLFAATLLGPLRLADLPVFAANSVAILLAFMLNCGSDAKEDKINNRPAFSFGLLAWAVLAASLAASALIAYVAGNPSFYIPVLILAISFLYSRALQLKRTFPLAHVSEGAVFALIFLSHALLRSALNQQVAEKTAIVFAIFAIGSMVKDYKDEKGDKAAGISTPFTILNEETARKFWLAFRALLVFGPMLLAYMEYGSLSMLRFAAYGIYVLASGYVLFLAELGRERLVDYFIWIFSLFLVLVSFLH